MDNEDIWRLYSGVGGIPFRTKDDNYLIRHDDPQERQPTIVEDAELEILDMSKDEDKLKYKKVLDSCCKGRSRLLREERVYDEDIKSWRILLVWADSYLEKPTERLGQNLKDQREVF